MRQPSWLQPPASNVRSLRLQRAAFAACVSIGACGAQSVAATAAQPALAAQSETLRSLIQESDLRRLYELGGWRRLWTLERAAQLQRAFEAADRHAISADVLKPRTLTADATELRDVELSRAALAYAQALALGVTNPDDSHAIFTLRRNAPDLVAGMADALSEDRVEAWLNELPPQDAEYLTLSAAYLRERAAIDASRMRIGDGPTLRMGSRDPRVAALALALSDTGTPLDQAGRTYDGRMEAAVRAFQQRAGLKVDGVVGPNTLAALNDGPFERARQIAVNLERRRWLARDPSLTRIDVNIAAARFTYYRDGVADWEGRVVAGAKGHETPQLWERFDEVVVNPPWYVPTSIANAEILPNGREYLANHDMYVDNGRVIQRPGPKAALGQVKFDMQNRYAIYLHDTPAKALFDAAARHRSHGCVRVEDAVAFARRLAEQRGQGAIFDAALGSGDTTVVQLGDAITVRLIYHTVIVEGGEVRYRPDVYGWDATVAERLGLPGEAQRSPDAATVVLGP